MAWYAAPSAPGPLCGASLSTLGSRSGPVLLQIGGNVPPPATAARKGGAQGAPKSSSELSPLLQVSSLHLRDMTWKPELVNTNGLLNRQYHASVAVSDSSVLVFGGTVTAIGNGQVAEEILEINRTIFGLTVSAVKTEMATCSLQGLSAVTSFAFPEGVALLYGGCTKDKRTYSSDLSLFLHRGDLALEGVGEGEGMVVLQVEGGAEGAPPARSFHCCSLTGPNGDVLLVHGGQGKSGELLGDVWMCDLSGVAAALREAAAPPSPSSEPGEEKQPATLPPVKWLCLLESSATVSPRYLHSGVAYVSTRDDLEPPAPCLQFGVFGGSSGGGKSAGMEYLEACLMLADDSISYTAQDFVLRETLPLPPRSALNGAALATVGSGNAPVGAVVFFCGSVGLLKVLNDASDLAVGMRRAVAKGVSAASAENKKEAPAASTGVGLPKKVRYAEGLYEGQLKRPPGETDEDPIVSESLVRHGRGTMRLASGETYEGSWSEGARQGQGTQSLGAEVYEGGFWADQRHGQGVLTVSGTVVYEGEFQAGLYGGNGTQTADDGVYRGEFVAGKRHGQGCLTNHDTGYVYDGAWEAGVISGVGRVSDLPVCEASSEGGGLQGVYQGPTLDGIPSGADGFCAYQDGSEYLGEWKSGKRNGQGRYTHNNNDEFQGKWVGDQRWKGRWTSAQGNEYYDGYWQNNRPHGAGLRLYANGDQFDGEWASGKRVGVSIQMQATADIKQWG